MREQPLRWPDTLRTSGSRKYLNAAERLRFVEAASRMSSKVRLFCLTLRWSGACISEVLALFESTLSVLFKSTIKFCQRGSCENRSAGPVIFRRQRASEWQHPAEPNSRRSSSAVGTRVSTSPTLSKNLPSTLSATDSQTAISGRAYSLQNCSGVIFPASIS